MQTKAHRSRGHATILMTLLPAALLLLASYACHSIKPRSTLDLTPFKAMARTGQCADIRNRLFLIDNQMVFWDRAGNCADAAYSETLYGSSPDQVLCVSHDSIAGPMKSCQDELHQNVFDTITANHDQADLGLGPEHTVLPVPF